MRALAVVVLVLGLLALSLGQTLTATATTTPSPTISVTSSVTPTISVTSSVTPTISVTSSVTPTISVTSSISVSSSVTPTISVTSSISVSTSVTSSITPSNSLSSSNSPTSSVTPSITPSNSLSSSNSPTSSVTSSITPSNSVTSSNSPTSSVTSSISVSRSLSATPTTSSSVSATVSPTPSSSVPPPAISVIRDGATLTSGSTITFPGQVLSSTAGAAGSVVLTLRNTGGPGTVTGVTLAAPFTTTYTGGAIAAGASVQVTLNVPVNADGTFTSTFSFTVGGTTFTFPLSAQVLAITLSTPDGKSLTSGATFDFGSVGSSASSTKELTFAVPASKKRAPVALTLSAVSVDPANGAFSLTNAPGATGTVINPGQTFKLGVKFTPPAAAGVSASTLKFSLNGVQFSTPLSATTTAVTGDTRILISFAGLVTFT